MRAEGRILGATTTARACAPHGRRALVTLALVALAGGLPVVARAATVERLEVQGNEFLSDEAVLALTDIEPGDPFDPQALQGEFWKLWNTGLFDDVGIFEADGDAGGKVVIFSVREKPRVDSVTFERVKALNDSRIEEVLKGNDAYIEVNSTLDQERISLTKRILEELLASEGHPEGRVTVDQRRVSQSRVALDFRIDPGPKVKIANLEFTGNTVFGQKQLKKMLEQTREKGLFSFISDKSVYYRPRFLEDLQGVVQEYKAKGYLQVRIGEPVMKDARPGKSGKEQRELVTLVVPIEEGAQYRLGRLTISGNTVFDTGTLRALIPLAEGEVLNDRLLRLGRTRIDNRYGDEGYLYALTTPRYSPDDERLVADVDMQVVEGEQYTVRRIAFDGNVRTRDEVLRREMRVQEGDVFSRRAFLVSMRKIAQLGFFELEGEPRIEPVQEAEGEPEVDITVAGKEVGRNEIQFGGGYSGVDGFFGTFSFSSLNFLGRGAQFSVSGQLGGETTRYSLSYIEPYIAHTRSTIGGSLFVREQDFDGFDREGQGGSIFWSYPTSTFSAFRLTGAWEESEIVNTFTGVDDSKITTYTITPSMTFDSRDNPIRPTRGRRLTGALELGAANDDALPWGVLDPNPEADQGTVNYLKPRAGYTNYWRTGRKQYMGVHLEGGMLAPISGGALDTVPADGIDTPYLPIFERYFLGGERSIRSVETRSVGPRVIQDDGSGNLITSEDGIALGGDQYYLLNFEYSFPFSDAFELTTFVDIGNAYGVDHVDLSDVIDPMNAQNIEIRDSDPFDVKATAGLEFRFHTPILQQPLRLIYGCKVAGDFFDDDSNCNFQFSIGRTFQ